MAKKQVTINLPLPLPQQEEPLASHARFKLWRWGRRAGKTDGAVIASCVGQGSKPNGKGFLTGGTILWIARDYTQAEVAWRRQFRPRFKGKPGFDVNEKFRRISLVAPIAGVPTGGGEFKMTSAENIDSDRGDHWDGVVIDEAAFLDLKDILLDVIRPGLMDTQGWLIVMSTTRMGSYFNELAQQIMDGDRPGWEHTHLTARDNPKIDNDEIEGMVEEYDDEVKLQEEVFADLLVEGGLAFREWRSAAHVVTLATIPDWWVPVGVMDWGYEKNGYLGLAMLGDNGQIYARAEYVFKHTHPRLVGEEFARMLVAKRLPIPAYILADAAMWIKAESAETTADKVMQGMRKVLKDNAPALVAAPKGPGSRVQGVVAFHEHLSFETENESGIPEEHEAPKFRVHPECAYLAKTIPQLPRSKKNSEDVDTNAEDHAFDAYKGLLLSFRPEGERPGAPDLREEPGRFPGVDRETGRVRTRAVDQVLREHSPEGELDAAFHAGWEGHYVVP